MWSPIAKFSESSQGCGSHSASRRTRASSGKWPSTTPAHGWPPPVPMASCVCGAACVARQSNVRSVTSARAVVVCVLAAAPHAPQAQDGTFHACSMGKAMQTLCDSKLECVQQHGARQRLQGTQQMRWHHLRAATRSAPAPLCGQRRTRSSVATRTTSLTCPGATTSSCSPPAATRRCGCGTSALRPP